MSSAELGNEQISNAIINNQHALLGNNTSTLKRSQEEDLYDSGIPAKRTAMNVMESNLVQIGGPYMGQNESITELYPVPENTVGLVIGRGGSEIQSIQTQSGCRVQMSPDADNSGFRQVNLQGARLNIERAKQLINEVVLRAQARQQQTAMANFSVESPRSKTIEIAIPANKCGLIIGKQGDTIRQLQEQSGCKMMMVQDTQEVTGMAKPLRIIGEPEKLEIAQKLVAELVSKEVDPGMGGQTGGGGSNRIPSDGNATAKGEVVVPRSSVGMIIGKGGETIKRLAVETGTKIQFKPDEDPNSPERCAVIMGTRDQIFKATELITELVNKSNIAGSQQQEVFYMHIPANKTGLVIGKGGETIKQINAESGAHCELSREPPPNNQEKVFMIKGTPSQIHHAVHIIRIKVGDLPPNTPVPMLANGSFQVSNQYNGQYGGQQGQVQQQWTQYGGAAVATTESGVWNQNPYFAQSTQAATQPAAQYAAPFQAQQQAANPPVQQFAQPQAQQPTVVATSQPTINPQTGQPDYSAQWAEYYRSVGLLDQAAMVETQMKQAAAARAAAATAQGTPAAGYNNVYPPGTNPPAQQAQPAQQFQALQPGFPQTGQFQAQQTTQF